MDCLGNEISQKMKNTIRAKLIELDVYVDDELPDYIMVLVANKKTDKQIEDDLKLFLGVHTTTFVQWLNDLLDKLKDLTGKGDNNSESKVKPKGKEKKLKLTKSSKAPDTVQNPESSKKTDSLPAVKKKTIAIVPGAVKSSKPDSKHEGNIVDDKSLKRKKLQINEELAAKKLKNSPSAEEKKTTKSEKSKKTIHDQKSGKKSLKRTSNDVISALKDGSDVGDDSEQIAEKKLKTTEQSKSHVSSPADSHTKDTNSTSAKPKHVKIKTFSEPISHSSETPEEEHYGTEQRRAVLTRHVRVTAPHDSVSSVETSSTKTVVKGAATKFMSDTAPVESKVGAAGADRRPVVRRLVALTRTVGAEERGTSAPVSVGAPGAKPTLRAGLFSRVGAIVSRSLTDEEESYDPTRPAVGRVASTVKVSERSLPPAHRQARPTLLMKAMRDAQKSTVASVKPFLVRETTSAAAKVTAQTSGQDHDLRAKLSTADGPDPKPRKPPAKEYRQDLMQIAITVRNNCDAQATSQKSAVVQRQTRGSPTKKLIGGPAGLADALREDHEGEEEEEDGVNVTIGSLQPPDDQKSVVLQTEKEVRGSDTGAVDVSADGYIASLLHQTGTDTVANPASGDKSGPTFVVTMTGLGSGQEDTTVTEEVEEVEEEVVEEEIPASAKRPPVFTRKNRVKMAVSTGADSAPASDAVSTTANGDPADNIDRTLERCRFWPSCKSGSSCQFYHPTSACALFPRCGPADRCASIHPPCRYDGVCTRTDCQFSHARRHTAAATPSTAAAPPLPQARLRQAARAPALLAPPSAVNCRFANNCKNQSCRYQHPPPCRYGAACKNRLCSFTHVTVTSLPRADRHQYKWAAATS